MPELGGSRTEGILQEAFAAESRANRRYLWFAQQAELEGYPEIAALFRSVAEGETGHAFGHLEFLAAGGGGSEQPGGSTAANLAEAIEGEVREATEMYPGYARVAREEGFPAIAEWFEALARAERSHAERFRRGLESTWTLP